MACRAPFCWSKYTTNYDVEVKLILVISKNKFAEATPKKLTYAFDASFHTFKCVF